MSRRYVYDRIDHLELSRRLNAIGMTARDLERATGADGRRVMRWLGGEEDIPPHVDLLTHVLLSLPQASQLVEAWVARNARDVRIDCARRS